MDSNLTFNWLIPVLCILVCGIFLVVVIYYTRKFLKEIDFHKSIILKINPARFDSIKTIRDFIWFNWIFNQTQNPKLTPPSRTEAMQEFDRLYFYRNDYAFLIRSKDYAPFIGLLLTAIAAGFFYIFELKSLGNESPGKIIEHVLPLMIGVAAGALLNLICSGMLQLINSKFNAYRRVAFDWFDSASRQARTALEEDAKNQILAQITVTDANISEQITQYLAKSLAKTEKIQSENDQLIQSAIAATRAAQIASEQASQATKALNQDINLLCENLNTNVSEMTKTLSTNSNRIAKLTAKYDTELQAFSNCTQELGKAWLSLQPDIRAIAETSGELIASTRLFRDSLEPAAQRIQSASQQYAHLTNAIGESTGTISKNIKLFESSLTTNIKIFELMHVTVQTELIPTCQRLAKSVGELEQNTHNLDHQTQQMITSLDAAGTGFQRFDNMSKSFSQAVKNEFLPAVAALIEIPIIVQELKQSTDAAGQSLQTSSLAIKQAFEENRNNFFSANSSIEKLQNLIKNASSAASGLNTSATAFSSIIQIFKIHLFY